LENLFLIKKSNQINACEKEKKYTVKSIFHVVSFLLCSSIILNVVGLGQLSFFVTASTEGQICCADDVAGVCELNLGIFFLEEISLKSNLLDNVNEKDKK
jgi:hypothetical protein